MEQSTLPLPKEEQSPSLGALAAALAKAQGEMSAAAKDKLNPHFKSKYADLASTWDACRTALSKNGLCVVQRVSDHKDGISVRTRLMHSSGEWMESTLVVPIAQRTAQAIGSSVTYARRYALQAMVGVAADDDDGNDATAAAPANSDAPPPTGKRTGNAGVKAQLSAKTSKLPAQGEMVVGQSPANTDEEALDLLAEEFGLNRTRVMLRARGILNGKTSGFTQDDINAIRGALQAVPPQ